MSLATSRSVLITGCSEGGIGYALAKEYRSRGLKVFATARRLQSIESLESLGIDILELDVTKPESISAAKDKIGSLNSGKLDILVNNAGIVHHLPFTDLEMSAVRDLYETNVFGVMAVTQAFVPLLIASGHGKIINIGSIVAVMSTPWGSIYNSSKAALHSWANSLRIELKPFNIDVVTIVTGAVKSRLMSNNETTLPESSLYSSMRDLFQERRTKDTDEATPTDTYARDVVSKTLKSRPSAYIWSGKFSSLIWLLSTFGSTTVFDSMMFKRFGLDIFTRRWRSSKHT
ncbi:NAD(P)-binding protein [Sistotremastrum suecicum HHB10207 ss-3]|uniref:NAD(P)-binding protein n=1 Tax=Sistotremastrum suecicum HHB10207 ss-3 TaxID=1314776 RepID=A0A166FAY4_9AGAM|nr:NAD(P)-binding protein [Sistotremastrum suecicum HHB10207 ss-3]